MDLDEESSRTARIKFAKILALQVSLTALPLLLISVLFFMGPAQKVAEFSWDRVHDFYASVQLDPGDGLATLAVVAAIVLALSLDGSAGNYEQFNHSEFIFAYAVKKFLLVACGIVVSYIAFFALVGLIFDLTGATSVEVDFASVSVILLALVILVLSAARVRHRQVESSQLSHLIEKEQKKNELISSRWRSRWGNQLAPWQKFRPLHALCWFGGIVLSWAATIMFIYLSTGERWNFSSVTANVVLESIFVFILPFVFLSLMVHSVRNKNWTDFFVTVIAVLPTWFLMFYLVWHGLQYFNEYPALSAIWIFPTFIMIISSVSIFIPPRNKWPLWLLMFRPMNRLYYLMERDIENMRIKAHLKYVGRLSRELNQFRTSH